MKTVLTIATTAIVTTLVLTDAFAWIVLASNAPYLR